MKIKTTRISLVTIALTILFGISASWADDYASGRERRHGKSPANQHHERYANAKPGKFQGGTFRQKQAVQAARVRHGNRAGQIHRAEPFRGKARPKWIGRADHGSKTDGHFNRHERGHLNRMGHGAGRHIYRSEHIYVYPHRHGYPGHFTPWRHLHPGWSRFSAGVWDSGWSFSFSVSGR